MNMSEWARKDKHGLYWGHWIRKASATDWCIHRGNYEPCFDISQTDGSRHCFKLGNEWISKPESPFYGKPFQHPQNYSHDNWHFWDNPEIPQLMWRNPANPTASKDWIRWVPSEILTSKHTASGSDRINKLLKRYSSGRITAWQEIAPVRSVSINSSKTLLIVPSSEPNYPNYYATTQRDWLQDQIQIVLDLGFDYEIRFKQGRKSRSLGNELTDQLRSGHYVATISQHSVAAMETVMAGYPAVVTGPHPAGELATPLEEFKRKHLRTPTAYETVEWCDTLLGNCYHKQEIFEGSWKDAS